MDFLTTIMHWIDFAFFVGWPVILVSDLFLRSIQPHASRMRRGEWRAWEMRHFGFMGRPMILTFLAFGFGIPMFLITGSRFSTHLFWVYILLSMIVDWITGGDEPGRRVKKAASEVVKKLKINPAPRPVIDVGR